jgi:hypothetical protein
MIPHERSLVKRLEGKPFALIGVNTDGDQQEVKSKSIKNEITWRSFWDDQRNSKVCKQWNVEMFPTIFVIDHSGIIRGTVHSGEEMEQLVDKLLKEMDEKNAAQPQ